MTINYDKKGGLVPAIVQDVATGRVLMLGYMNEEAVRVTRETGLVTFFSRSRQRLWTKGESSGNHLELRDLRVDCDGDALLVSAAPKGPTCHTGSDTCWDESNDVPIRFLEQLGAVVAERAEAPPETSYTRRLLDGGPAKSGQKVGEEAVETVIAALVEDDDHLIDESADLVYHLVVLLRSRGLSLDDVARRLRTRHQEAT